jgi:hypothetical protein
LWSLWSKPSLWSWDHAAMRVRSLAGRLLILQLTVVAVTVTAGALVTVLVARERTETAARERAVTIARCPTSRPPCDRATRRRACSPWRSGCARSRASTSWSS